MSTIDGFYVGPNGKMISVVATHTVNPRIVDLSAHNLGLVVVDSEFFEDEETAIEQSKFNAEETIQECNDLLDELEKPKRRAVPQGNSKSGWGRKAADPLGPPKYGVGKTLRHLKSGMEYKIIGFNNEADDGVEYMLSRVNGKGSMRLYRDQIDASYEVL
ncbi:MAG: hypothetical protein KGL39_46755 [Patescibacteria group bacterium]|nr:hypothetical protein [Patescibacteria group bacterium]